MGVSGGILTQAETREAIITAVVTRADGTVEDLGMVSYWHRNPIRRWWHNLRLKLKG